MTYVPSGGDAASFVRDSMWAVTNDMGLKHPNDLPTDVRNAIVLIGNYLAFPRIMGQFRVGRAYLASAKKQARIANAYAQEIIEMQAQVRELRQALWDIAGIAGADLDGSPTPDVVEPKLTEYVKGVVQELRDDYNDLLAEEKVNDASRDHAHGEVPESPV